MAAGAEFRVGIVRVAAGDQADEGGDADVGRRLPDAHVEVRCGEAVQHQPAAGVVDALRLDAASRLRLRRGERPQGGGVPLDHLAQPVQDRLGEMVAGSEAVGVGDEAAAAGGGRQGIIGVYQLVRQPDRAAAQQVLTRDPQNPQVGMHAAVGRHRQPGDVAQPGTKA